jgi:hypothetical protein
MGTSISSPDVAFLFIYYFLGWIIGLFISQIYSFVALPLITYLLLPFIKRPDFYRLFAGASISFFSPLATFSMWMDITDLILYWFLIAAWTQAIAVLGFYIRYLSRLMSGGR